MTFTALGEAIARTRQSLHEGVEGNKMPELAKKALVQRINQEMNRLAVQICDLEIDIHKRTIQ